MNLLDVSLGVKSLVMAFVFRPARLVAVRFVMANVQLRAEMLVEDAHQVVA